MQKIIENGTTVLLADEGMMLTDDSSFGTTVRLGKEADATLWYEITAEEAEKRMNEPEVPADDITRQKAEAYDVLMGVSE
jgi:hypothetical protein